MDTDREASDGSVTPAAADAGSTSSPQTNGPIPADVYKTLIDSFAKAIWETDAAGQVVADSPTWRSYTGQTVAQWLDQGWPGAVHPDEQAAVGQTWLEALRSQTTFETEARLCQPGGGWQWTALQATPMLNPDGSVSRWLGIAVDIQARKRAEAEVSESEERYRSLFNAIDEGFCTIEVLYDEQGQAIDHRIVAANPAFARQTGLQHPEGKRASELMPGVEPYWNDLYAFVVQTGEPTRSEYHSPAFDRWFDVLISRIGEADTHRVAVVFTDITSRKKMEETLRRSEERCRSLFNSIDEAYSVFRMLFDGDNKPLDGLIEDVNPAFEKITGLRQAVGKTIRELVPAVEESWIEECGAIALTGESRRFDGAAAGLDNHSYDGYAFRLGDAQKRTVAVVFTDVTERKKQEANRAFLADITHELSRLSTAEDIMTTVGAKIGAYLRVKSCLYFDVDDERGEVTVLGAWNTADVPSLRNQTLRLSDFINDEFARANRVGEEVVVDNTYTDPRSKGKDYAVIGIGAFVTVPFHRNGLWTNYLAVTDLQPRDWHDDEIELFRELSARIFPRLERARAEEHLHQSEARMRIAVEAAHMGTWEWNLLTDETYWNEQHFRLFGMEPQPGHPLKSADFIRHVHPDDRDWVISLLDRAIRERVSYEAEFRAVRDDNEQVRWMKGYGRATDEADGKPTRMSGVMYDIDDRKRADDELRASEERFRTLVQNLPDYAIYRIDPKGIITEWTEGAQRVKGYTADEVLGRSFAMFFTPEGLAAGELDTELTEATETGRAERESVSIRKGGERFWINEILTAIRDADGQLMGFTKICRNITERKRAEAALGQSEEQLRIVMDSITEHAIITTDTEGIITGWNPGAQQLFGWMADEVMAQSMALTFTAKDREADEPEREMATARERGKAADERYHQRKDGSQFYVSGVMSPLHDAAGQLLGYVKVARDLTERRQMEQALREADRRKDEFLAMLAHELRNPLAPIRNILQVLQLTSEDDETVGPALTMMSRQVDHLVRLIDDLLDVSRISRGKIDLRRDRLDLTVIVRQAVEAVRPLYEAGGRQLSVNLPALPVNLLGDATRLMQVVTNLLTNGARYTLTGGHVWLTVEQADRHIRLRVRDNGIGIAPDQLDVIFELFVQVDNSLARSQGGLGLGRTLVRKLVEMHGGQVEARSEGLGMGSEFVITLPVYPEQDPTMFTKTETAATPTSGYRMLVVDDNRDAADTLAMLLKLKKHAVQVCYGGREAVIAAQSGQPEVVLLDIGMPELDGYQTCRLIREGAGGKSMVLIALTGYGQTEDIRQSLEAGFDGHLTKPVDLATLTRLVDGLLAKR